MNGTDWRHWWISRASVRRVVVVYVEWGWWILQWGGSSASSVLSLAASGYFTTPRVFFYVNIAGTFLKQLLVIILRKINQISSGENAGIHCNLHFSHIIHSDKMKLTWKSAWAPLNLRPNCNFKLCRKHHALHISIVWILLQTKSGLM